MELDDFLVEQKGIDLIGVGIFLDDCSIYEFQVHITDQSDKTLLPFLPQSFQGYKVTYVYATPPQFAQQKTDKPI
ncbi:MAG: hypothetical protein V1867_00745 [Candidatus Falkowbacteria bacterium]